MTNQLSILAVLKNLPKTIGGMFRSKYLEIILAVGLFILLDTGVLIINFYTSYQIANDAHAIQVASRMSTLSESLLNELYEVRDDAADPGADYFATIDILAKTFKVYDETLDAFIYGGELIGEGQGQDALLQDTAYRDTSAHLLKDAEKIWQVYRTKLKPIVYAYFNDADRQTVLADSQVAINYARAQSGKLLELMHNFTFAVEEVAKRKAQRLRMIQTIGITLAVLNFFLILFHFLTRLRRSDKLIEQSRKETEDILENVNEGLFLLDKDYVIGSQHSKSLIHFFGNDSLAGSNFIELMRPMVAEKTLETLEEFTEILYSPRVNESLITDLNPLNEVEINLTSETGAFETRYFSFQFSRVYDKGDFNTLLVTVKDVTKQIRLSQQLKEANEKVGKEIEMLMAIIHIDNRMLSDFLSTSLKSLNEVNLILKKPKTSISSLSEKLASISRIIHKLKGDSSALNLEFVMDKFHRYERLLFPLLEKEQLSGEDFLPLVVQLKHIMADLEMIKNMQEKMGPINLTANSSEANKAQSPSEPPIKLSTDIDWIHQMTILAGKVAEDYEKQAHLDMSGFNAALLSERQTEPIKDIITQSIRNAVAHGIETPDNRVSVGKSREGNLKVTLSQNDSRLQLVVRDDGAGIDLDKIKQTALAKGLVSEKQLTSMHRSKLLSFIFKQGFSTSEGQGVHAGQGVGMDLVKSKLDSLNGQIKVKYQIGGYTEFQYFFSSETSAIQ